MKSPILDVIAIGLLVLLPAVSGCAVLELNRPVEIHGLLIQNATNADIRDVQLVVEKTRTIVTCSFIPAGGKFSTEFPLREYQGNYIIASWQQNGQNFKTGPLHALIPEDLDPVNPVRGEVIINRPGQVVVQLAQ